jgi:ABC-2 type transport system ATP-binding protein
MAETVLSFDHVSKHFGSHEVLKDITFPLRRGECVALTGLNGSGKTTALKLAAGLTKASSGIIRTSGRIRTQYIPENFPRLAVSARSILRSFGRIEGLKAAALDQRVDELLGSFHLREEAGKPLHTYSKGMLQKVSVIQAFLCGSDALLLDEPLSGQDTQSQETFIQLTKSLLCGGVAVLLACHEKYLIRALADTVFEIREGMLHTTQVPPEEGEDLYLFDIPREGFEIPKDYENPLMIKKDSSKLLITVRHGTGDRMLRAMLEAGCRLEGMRHEKDR